MRHWASWRGRGRVIGLRCRDYSCIGYSCEVWISECDRIRRGKRGEKWCRVIPADRGRGQSYLYLLACLNNSITDCLVVCQGEDPPFQKQVCGGAMRSHHHIPVFEKVLAVRSQKER